MMRHDPDDHGRCTEAEVCGCPTHPSGNGDIPCHRCGEYVNVRCWNCGTPRGEGKCPCPKGGNDAA